MVSRLGEENKTTDTFKEFVSASKEDQLKIKDVGGYGGGYLRGGKRSPANVVHSGLLYTSPRILAPVTGTSSKQ